MHQCDLYVVGTSQMQEDANAPLVMREKACEEARIKAAMSILSRKSSSKNKSDYNVKML